MTVVLMVGFSAHQATPSFVALINTMGTKLLTCYKIMLIIQKLYDHAVQQCPRLGKLNVLYSLKLMGKACAVLLHQRTFLYKRNSLHT